jgi:hypothetical protein
MLMAFIHSHTFQMLSGITVGSVWLFHGLYSKILNGIPRHRQIIARILGNRIAGVATVAIGLFEILLGVWAFSGSWRIECALVQTLAIVAMNTLEIRLARELLISAMGMVFLNLGFLWLIWNWALFVPNP